MLAATIIAIGVNTDGRREVFGMEIGTSGAEPIWTEFLRKLTRRGLQGGKLVISDAHEGIKAAVSKVLSATWQRCRVHVQRNALAHAGKSGRRPRRENDPPDRFLARLDLSLHRDCLCPGHHRDREQPVAGGGRSD